MRENIIATGVCIGFALVIAALAHPRTAALRSINDLTLISDVRLAAIRPERALLDASAGSGVLADSSMWSMSAGSTTSFAGDGLMTGGSRSPALAARLESPKILARR